jgi:hypothetical protein
MGWAAVVMVTCLLTSALAPAQEKSDGAWPREIVVPEGTMVIYQPQPDKLEGDILSARAAVAIELKGSKEPVFGVMWADARLETDRSNRTATIVDVKVTELRFPEEDKEREKKIKALIEREAPQWDYVIDMDRLLTTLEIADKRLEDAEKIETRPPKILIYNEPTILISLDGDPRLVQEKGSNLKRVVNTPFTILFDPSAKTYWLYADVDSWYAARDVKGEWTLAKSVPSEVAARAPKADPEEEEADKEDAEKEDAEPGPPPKIVVETEPAELIVIKGEPEYTPITGTDLLYVSNTDSDVLMDIGGQKHYILLSGRWYAGSGLDGPWKYVPGEDLPDYFALIPEDSQMGTVLYAVPGTEIAKEAVLDAQIPQTAAVERAKASLAVEYDGEPKFEKIKGTKMTYAVNTVTPVIFAEKKYYASGGHLYHSARLTPLQRDLCACLQGHARGRVRRLHAGLHIHLRLPQHHRLRNRVLLARLVRPLLLPPPVDLGLSRALQPVERLGFRAQLQQRPVHLLHRPRRRLVPRRLVGAIPLPRLSPRLQSRLPARGQPGVPGGLSCGEAPRVARQPLPHPTQRGEDDVCFTEGGRPVEDLIGEIRRPVVEGGQREQPSQQRLRRPQR